jgi:hypothetical protein
MSYFQRKSKIMKFLSYIALIATFGCLLTGAAFFAIILMMLSLHLSTESELCKMRAVVIQLIHNQNVMMGVGGENQEVSTRK